MILGSGPIRGTMVMAAVASYLKGPEDKAASQWSDIALKLLERAPDRMAVLREFTSRLRPSGWSGSLATILEGRKALLAELENHADASVAKFATAVGTGLSTAIEKQRIWETDHDRTTDERFE